MQPRISLGLLIVEATSNNQSKQGTVLSQRTFPTRQIISENILEKKENVGLQWHVHPDPTGFYLHQSVFDCTIEKTKAFLHEVGVDVNFSFEMQCSGFLRKKSYGIQSSTITMKIL